jgi:hypothetical protein
MWPNVPIVVKKSHKNYSHIFLLLSVLMFLKFLRISLRGERNYADLCRQRYILLFRYLGNSGKKIQKLKC